MDAYPWHFPFWSATIGGVSARKTACPMQFIQGVIPYSVLT
jgi:hypothetical protein